jgi:spermidine synthase
VHINKNRSFLLKIALFATGLSGIVAEYILSTLASYFLGDSVIQWTLTLSFMLFAMGIGSRISKYMEKDLLFKFIQIELLLSLLVSFSTLIAYLSFGQLGFSAVVIYSLSIAIGTLIGLEIPLILRLNHVFEKLHFNVANVMEMDYFGSLLGGLFFAFIGLPYMGLTYTPILLGCINFAVSLVLFYTFRKVFTDALRKKGVILFSLTGLVLLSSIWVNEPIILHQEQKRFKDLVIYSEQSAYQQITITRWKDDYWLFLNGHQQFSTIDEERYHEVLVHPALSLHPNPREVLIMGGGDGIAAKEVLKHPKVQQITLVDLDPAVTNLAKTHPILTAVNGGALNNPKVKVLNQDAFVFMQQDKAMWDVIIIDLPDPKTVELSRLYTLEFYKMCFQQLRPGGKIITQAGSPYFATDAFRCIWKTMDEAGFATLPLHNHVISLGEWGWVYGQKSTKGSVVIKTFQEAKIEVPTRWLNTSGLELITSFGKDMPPLDEEDPVNKIQDPELYRLYLNGNWDLY